ncbi:MAG: hypothetical protein ACI9KE_004830, partial [Polyangiales bacterium]
MSQAWTHDITVNLEAHRLRWSGLLFVLSIVLGSACG